MNIHLHPFNDKYPPWESATDQWCFAVPFQVIIKSSCPLVLKLRARFLLPFVAVSLGPAVLEEGGGWSMVAPLLSSLSEILDQGTSFWRPPVTQFQGMWSQYWQDTPTDHMVCVCARACVPARGMGTAPSTLHIPPSRQMASKGRHAAMSLDIELLKWGHFGAKSLVKQQS